MAFYDGTAANSGEIPTTESEQFFNDPSWGFQDSPPYDSYDTFYQDDWKADQQSSVVASGLSSELTPPSLTAKAPQSLPASASTTVQPYPNLPPGSMHSLTESQRQKLQKIAMPSHLQYYSPPKSEPSPESSESRGKSVGMSSPESQSQGQSQGQLSNTESRKRKSSADSDDDDDEDGHQPIKKTAHNMIEKRYRTNLNDKIAALRDSVPSLRIMSKSARGEDTTEDREELHGLTPAHKLNKATVLSKATEYIRHLEKRNNRLSEENNAMQARIAAFEKLFMAGAMNGGISPVQQQSPTPGPYAQDPGFSNSPMPTPPHDPQGMIQVPEDMKRIIAAQLATGQPYPVPQQPYRPNPAVVRQQQIQQQMHGRGWQNAGPYFGKLMVGSLAGLMILEAAREKEQSSDSPQGRGLFAVPVQLLGSLMSLDFNLMGYHIAANQLLFSLKVLLLLCSICWIVYPSLMSRKPPSPKAPKSAETWLEAVPSLASPIHVRRQAWLTAIQTVWVPRHNFFLEAAALVLKTLKLSSRNLIGVDGYQMLTGLTPEQEVARVKAWTIALDAQLAGGDVGISKSRLTLTLLASGTLPDTPLRLMLKALHIRVLLWEVGLTGIRMGVFNTIASMLARRKWIEARQLHRTSSQLRSAGQEPSDDDLPDHLAMLLEQDADEVLNPSIVQRAHNLAWNRPTQQNAIGVTDGMDMVVEDAAVRSPMDAVAAWWSSMTLHSALRESLLIRDDEEDGDVTQLVEEGVTLAIRTAPIGSVAQNRALVARAVLFKEKRGANIAAVIQAVGPVTASATKSEDGESDESTATNPSIAIPSFIKTEAEIYMCLQCAKAIAHLQRYAPPEEPVNIYGLIDSEIHVNNDTSLLGYTAAFTVMERLAGHEFAAEACSNALERLSGDVRTSAGKDMTLDQDVKQEVVERCLAVTRNIVGMDIETDTGYGSMSESEDFGDCSEESEPTETESQPVISTADNPKPGCCC